MADSISPCVMEVEIIRNNVWIKEGLRSASCVLHLGGIFGLNYRILWMMVVMPVCHSGYHCTYMSKDTILRFQKSRKERLHIELYCGDDDYKVLHRSSWQ